MNKKTISDLAQIVLSEITKSNYTTQTKYQFMREIQRFEDYCRTNGFHYFSDAIANSYVIAHYSDCSKSVCDTAKRVMSRFQCADSGVIWKPIRNPRKKFTSSCFDEIIKTYFDYLVQTGKREDNVYSRTHSVAKFLAYVEACGFNNLNQLTVKIVHDAFNKAANRKNFKTLIGNFLKYAFTYELTSMNFALVIPRVLGHQTIQSIYSKEEVETLLSSFDRTTELGKRNYAVALIAARLGIRASDIAGLKFENIKRDHKIIEITQSKTNNVQKLVLLDEIDDAINDYCKNGRPKSEDSHIFINQRGYGALKSSNISILIRRSMINTSIEIGNRRKGSHTLRSSLATALLEEGNSFHTVQSALGHKDIDTTKIYARVEIEKLRTFAMPVPQPSGIFAKLLKTEVLD